ncbi:hypothetical protein ABZ721_05580 [Streptomyces sp. NPDC006733]|uniref:hypothetical protein n=1 Tax=Streptomyces sp. NPDC006733 TaxID=3155460 RepID=UPI0033C855B3
MNGSGEVCGQLGDGEALDRLAHALGQPPRSMTENAQALFALLHSDDRARGAEAVPAGSSAPADPVRG